MLKGYGNSSYSVEQVGKNWVGINPLMANAGNIQAEQVLYSHPASLATEMAAKHAKLNGTMEKTVRQRYLFQVKHGSFPIRTVCGGRTPQSTLHVPRNRSIGCWRRLSNDRCDRVVIISADDVTGDDLWEWISAELLLVGRVIHNVVENRFAFQQEKMVDSRYGCKTAFVVERVWGTTLKCSMMANSRQRISIQHITALV